MPLKQSPDLPRQPVVLFPFLPCNQFEGVGVTSGNAVGKGDTGWKQQLSLCLSACGPKPSPGLICRVVTGREPQLCSCGDAELHCHPLCTRWEQRGRFAPSFGGQGETREMEKSFL